MTPRVWIARLRAPDRSASVERGFRRWLAEKPSHASAYETISAAWELTAGLERRAFPRLSPWERAGFRSGFLRSTAAVAAAAVLAAVGVALYIRSAGIATDVGEQRVLTLEDGTRISMNTASRLAVRYSDIQRRVELRAGEALFEVAKDPARPFIVLAGDRRIEALGTSFLVRDDARQLSVTLVEGKVAVSDIGTLSPGERITLARDGPPLIDRPQVEKITAWRHGQVDLDDAPLAEAVEEMNRYSPVKLKVGSVEATQLRINGVFRAGDTGGFAAAVARSYGLRVEHRPREILLTGVPAAEALSEDMR